MLSNSTLPGTVEAYNRTHHELYIYQKNPSHSKCRHLFATICSIQTFRTVRYVWWEREQQHVHPSSFPEKFGRRLPPFPLVATVEILWTISGLVSHLDLVAFFGRYICQPLNLLSSHVVADWQNFIFFKIVVVMMACIMNETIIQSECLNECGLEMLDFVLC